MRAITTVLFTLFTMLLYGQQQNPTKPLVRFNLETEKLQTYKGGNWVNLEFGTVDSLTYSGDTLRLYQNGSATPLKVPIDSVGGGASTAVDTFTFLATGQSNMEGRYITGDTTRNENVYLWNNTANAWQVADVGVNLTYNSPAFQFAKEYQREAGGFVRFFLISQGGQSITKWQQDSTQYNSIRSEINAADTVDIDAILWHQGESDTSKTNAEYYTILNEVYEAFVSEAWFSASRPFVAGGLYNGSNAGLDLQNASLVRLNSDTYPYTAFTRADGLYSPDSLHFGGTAIDSLGARYYRALMSLPQNETLIADLQGISRQIAPASITLDADFSFFRVFEMDNSSVVDTLVISFSNPIAGGVYRFSGIAATDTLYYKWPDNFLNLDNSTPLWVEYLTNFYRECYYNGDNFICATASQYPIAPLLPPTDSLFYWFAADVLVLDSVGSAIANNQGVATWTDLSGNGNNLTQSTSGNRPIYKATAGPNSKPSISFDGTDDWMDTPAHFWGSDDITIFVVLAHDNATRDAPETYIRKGETTDNTRQFFFYGHNAGNSYRTEFISYRDGGVDNLVQYYDGAKSASFRLISFSVNGSGTQEFGINADSQTVTRLVAGAGNDTINNSSTHGLAIGASNTNGTPLLFFQGDFCEIAVYSKKLSASEMTKAEQYFRNKYDLW